MTSAEHAATVREAHDTLIEACWSPDDVAEWVASLASLVALAERATELEDRLADGRDYELSIERDLADVRETLQAIRLALIDNDPDDALSIARAALGETAPSELPSHCVATSERTIAADGNPFRCAVCDNILVRHDGKLEIAALGETAPPAADPRLISYVDGRHRGKKAP